MKIYEIKDKLVRQSAISQFKKHIPNIPVLMNCHIGTFDLKNTIEGQEFWMQYSDYCKKERIDKEIIIINKGKKQKGHTESILFFFKEGQCYTAYELRQKTTIENVGGLLSKLRQRGILEVFERKKTKKGIVSNYRLLT